MTDILISSSVLIAALLLLRTLLWKSISRRVQYALWAVVLLRLLIPVNLPAFSLSVLNAGQKAQAAVTETIAKTISADPPGQVMPGGSSGITESSDSSEYPALSGDEKTAVSFAGKLSASDILSLVWKCGMTVMALWFLTANLHFRRKLRKCREPYHVESCKLPVYFCNKLKSPCLFGFPRPAIYLTPAADCSEGVLRHVLAHEETHFKHLDPLWSILRCICLVVYWFDPFVWAAAAASKADCELACDEAAIHSLGEGERIPYGETLLSLIPVRKTPADPMLSATTMTAGKRQLRDRITRIAENRRTVTAALLAAVVITMLLAACTFTGAKIQTGSTAMSSAVTSPSATGISLPDGEPDVSIPLTVLEPYEPAAVNAAPTQDISEFLTSPVPVDDYEVFLCRNKDGSVWAGYRHAEDSNIYLFQKVYWFADAVTNEAVNSVKPFTDVLGYYGFAVGYQSGADFAPYHDGMTGSIYNAHSYYFFDGYGTLRLLAQTAGNTYQDDWDGNGTDELFWSSLSPAIGELYFQRDGGLFCADLGGLVRDAYPDWDYMEFGSYNADKHYIIADGYITAVNGALAVRYLYFTGNSLLLYKDSRAVSDHVMSGIDVPDEVLSAAKDFVKESFKSGQSNSPLCGYDDWRIESLTCADTYDDFCGMDLDIYNMNYELHASHPENVVLAGGMYLTEENWVMPGYPYCTYLIFEVQDGKRVYLCSAMENDCSPDSELFMSDLRNNLMNQGLLPLSGLSSEELLYNFYCTPIAFLDQLAERPGSEQDAVCQELAYYQLNGTAEQTKQFNTAVETVAGSSLTDAEKAAYKRLFDHCVHTNPAVRSD